MRVFLGLPSLSGDFLREAPVTPRTPRSSTTTTTNLREKPAKLPKSVLTNKPEVAQNDLDQNQNQNIDFDPNLTADNDPGGSDDFSGGDDFGSGSDDNVV